MKIEYKVLDKMLSDLIKTDVITIKAKAELLEFMKEHDSNVLSQEVCEEMLGIYKLTLKPAYEAVTGLFLPNIFIRKVV